jgi:ABC-type phosphate/phosphonate transport system substrate-binding protein
MRKSVILGVVFFFATCTAALAGETIRLPVLSSGATTYRALVVAKAGTKPFGGIADLRGKRVAFCSLASAGESTAPSRRTARRSPAFS